MSAHVTGFFDVAYSVERIVAEAIRRVMFKKFAGFARKATQRCIREGPSVKTVLHLQVTDIVADWLDRAVTSFFMMLRHPVRWDDDETHKQTNGSWGIMIICGLTISDSVGAENARMGAPPRVPITKSSNSNPENSARTAQIKELDAMIVAARIHSDQIPRSDQRRLDLRLRGDFK